MAPVEGVPAPSVRVVDPTLARRTTANVAFSTLAQVVGKLGTFAWTAVAARRLGPAQFGVFTVVLSVALIVSAVAEWSFDVTLVQKVSSDPQHRNRYLTQALAWEGMLAVALFGLGGLALSASLSPEVRLGLALVLASVFLDSFSDTLRGAAAALQRQGATSLALIVQRLGAAGMAIALLATGHALTGLALALLLASAVGLAGSLLAVYRLGFRPERAALALATMRSFAARGWPIGVSSIVLVALFRLDAVMLSALRGSFALGTYSVAYKLFDTSLFFAFALNGALYPVMSAGSVSGSTLSRQEPIGAGLSSPLQSGLGALAFSYLPFAAVCLAEPHALLRLLFGAQYAAQAGSALEWLAFAPLAFGLSYLASSALNSRRRSGEMLVAAAIAAVVNVAANLVAIPLFAGAGAACTTTAAYLLQAIVGLAYLRRRFGVRLDLRSATALPLAGSVVLALLLRSLPLPLPVDLVVGLAAYLAICGFGMRRYQPAQWRAILMMLPGRAA